MRLASWALASLLFAITGASFYPFARFWKNEFWGLPPAHSITAEQLRGFGKVYAVFGIAFIVAFVGVLIGLLPKLIYVGDSPVQAVFLGADLVLLAVAVILAVRGWKLFQATRRADVEPLTSRG